MPKATRYPGLDIVRLAAALMVAAFHMTQNYAALHPSSPMFLTGWVGVELFFVISGFVITFSADGSSWSRFAINRAARLYPAAWICTALTVLIVPASIASIIRTVTLFPQGPWVEGVYWTLAIEIAFYALVGLFLWRGWPLVRLAVGMGSLSAIHWWALLAGVNLPMGWAVYGCYFALGMLLYERRFPAFGAFLFVTSALGCTMMRGEALGPPLEAAAIWTIGALIIIASVFWNHRLTWLNAKTIGLMTYPLYLIHRPVGNLVLGLGVVPAIIAGLAASLAILPAERLIRRWMLTAFHARQRTPVAADLP